MQNYRHLHVRDRVRIVSIPTFDQEAYERTEDDFTIRVLRRLIKKRAILTIRYILDGSPWFKYRFKNKGRMEYHSLCIMDNESWVLIKRRLKPKHVPAKKMGG